MVPPITSTTSDTIPGNYGISDDNQIVAPRPTSPHLQVYVSTVDDNHAGNDEVMVPPKERTIAKSQTRIPNSEEPKDTKPSPRKDIGTEVKLSTTVSNHFCLETPNDEPESDGQEPGDAKEGKLQQGPQGDAKEGKLQGGPLGDAKEGKQQAVSQTQDEQGNEEPRGANEGKLQVGSLANDEQEDV